MLFGSRSVNQPITDGCKSLVIWDPKFTIAKWPNYWKSPKLIQKNLCQLKSGVAKVLTSRFDQSKFKDDREILLQFLLIINFVFCCHRLKILSCKKIELTWSDILVIAFFNFVLLRARCKCCCGQYIFHFEPQQYAEICVVNFILFYLRFIIKIVS